MMMWHRRLGHADFRKVKLMSKYFPEMDLTSKSVKDFVCKPCRTGKSRIRNHRTKNVNERDAYDHIKPREVVSMDLKGPFEIESIGGSWYWLLIVDRNTKFLNIYFLNRGNTIPSTTRVLFHSDRLGIKISYNNK